MTHPKLTIEPSSDYHARSRDYLSSHMLREFRRCPLAYRQRVIGLIPSADTSAYLVGRATHALVLEGRDVYESQFVVGGPINPRTGNPYGRTTQKYAEWAESHLPRECLDDDQALLVESMAMGVRQHEVAKWIFAEGMAERVCRAEVAGMPCQARVDWLAAQDDGLLICDLKTTTQLDTFADDARGYGYIHQLAFYRRVLASGGVDTKPSAVVVAVEKQPPFRCGVWRIDETDLDDADAENRAALAELRECENSGNWPTRYETIRTLTKE